MPRYIGPYKIVEDFKNQSFRIDLPTDLKRRGVHDVFHSSLLQVHILNDDRLFPGRLDEQISSEGPMDPTTEWALDKILSHMQSEQNSVFKVKWKAGDITWVPYRDLANLPALATYLELVGVPNIDALPLGIANSEHGDPQYVSE